jgi:hypothetical protein
MSKREKTGAEKTAEPMESEALSLDKETLKDLDLGKDRDGDVGGGRAPIHTMGCETFGVECITTIRI